jgi:AcrR family transcriptional regulator
MSAVGRAPQISREAVLDAALRLADEQGLDAVTMHAVARRLQVTPMALYRHVDDKNALLDGLVEVLLTEYPLPRAEGEWDERLTALADGIRDTARGRSRPGRTPDQHGRPRLRRQRGQRPVPPARPVRHRRRLRRAPALAPSRAQLDAWFLIQNLS